MCLGGSRPADITKGYAVCREFEQGLDKQVLTEMPNAVIVTGTAGTGKTSTILRLAIGLQVAGKDVQYLDTEVGVSIQRLRSIIRQNAPDVLIIDDMDIFGTAAGPLLADLTGENPHLVVVAAVRSTHIDDLDIESNLTGRTSMVVNVPPLCDADIEALVDTLTRARRLGTLMGLPHERQCDILRQKSGRQLLVAMIEATSDLDPRVTRL
jgi:replication-associated recombination protein RarA